MKVTPMALPDLQLVESPMFSDDRGSFLEVFHREKFAAMGLPVDFCQDNHSRSHRGVLRGMHYQISLPQGKLVRVVQGTIFDVAVDLRRSSPTFGRWAGVTLRGDEGHLLWIPPGFAHGFLVLSEHAEVSYKCTSPYDPASERSIRWNDPSLAIEWPIDPSTVPVLSAKDAGAPLFAEAPTFDS